MISSNITMSLLGNAYSLVDSITKSGALDPKNYTPWSVSSLGLSGAPGAAGPGGSSGQSNAGGFVLPLDKQYIKKPSSGGDFGPRSAPTAGASTNHKGDDFSAPGGSKIYAAKGGKITVKPNNGGAGNTVTVDHGNGLVTKYFHMSRFATGKDGKPLKTGDTVDQGQVIGYVGTTGTSTGNHLHFEVHVNGNAVDPWPYLSGLI
jgi:murein DD-endopeptidase MepM/ murein hydrolase activator NlpD